MNAADTTDTGNSSNAGPAVQLAPAEPAKPLLVSKEITLIKNWREWKKLWDAETNAERLIGLLHVGFLVQSPNIAELADCIVFYFKVADGFGSEDNFRVGREGTIDYNVFGARNLSFVRQKIAQKALAAICKNVFTAKATTDRAPGWAHFVEVPEVMETILWFFRINERGRIQNISGSFDSDHQREVVQGFLRSFCKFFWEFIGFDALIRQEDSAFRERLEANRHRLIPIMEKLGMLGLFMPKKDDFDLGFAGFAMDKASLQVLRSIVMERKIDFPKALDNEERKPKTPTEALIGGTQAATVLHYILAVQAEKQRLAEIQKLKEEQKELAEKRKEAAKKIKSLAATAETP